jgi:HNH endonuclease
MLSIIPLISDAEYLRLILKYNEETGEWNWLISPKKGVMKGAKAGTLNLQNYHQIQINGKLYYSSRLAHLYMTGKWPKDTMDHKDRTRSNNKWENLKEATMKEQAANRSKK